MADKTNLKEWLDGVNVDGFPMMEDGPERAVIQFLHDVGFVNTGTIDNLGRYETDEDVADNLVVVDYDGCRVYQNWHEEGSRWWYYGSGNGSWDRDEAVFNGSSEEFLKYLKGDVGDLPDECFGGISEYKLVFEMTNGGDLSWD